MSSGEILDDILCIVGRIVIDDENLEFDNVRAQGRYCAKASEQGGCSVVRRDDYGGRKVCQRLLHYATR